MRTAVPVSRSATMRWWTNSMEPTSRPRVGWEATRTLRGRESSRARMAFCWLPPERVEMASSTSVTRTSNSSRIRWAAWRTRVGDSDGPRPREGSS